MSPTLLFLPFVYFMHTRHIVHEIKVSKENEMRYRGIEIRLSVNNRLETIRLSIRQKI